jgi:hypothetical protein
MLQQPGQEGAEVRQWERALAQQGLLDGRLFFSGAKVCAIVCYTNVVYSRASIYRRPGAA